MSKNKRERLKQAVRPYHISQNFLTGRKTLSNLLSKTDISRQDYVIEIGAGKGHITRVLSERCKCVCAYEIDDRLCRSFQSPQKGNVILRHQDFLKATLPSDSYKVFANIPFSITTDIVRKLTLAAQPPQDAWLIMERGTAMRFCGKPHDKAASLSLRPFFRVEIAAAVDRHEFHPMPSVDAAMLHIKLREQPDLPLSERTAFAAFVWLVFHDGIYGRNAPLTKKQVGMALRLAGLPELRPSDTILYVQWLCLFRCWRRFGGAS